METIFSQVPDAISGGSGWIGAGLLGSVLGWLLLKHLPAKDAQLEKLISTHNGQIEKLHATCAEEREAQSSKFDAILNRVMDRHTSDNRDMIGEMKSEFRALSEAITKTNGRP